MFNGPSCTTLWKIYGAANLAVMKPECQTRQGQNKIHCGRTATVSVDKLPKVRAQQTKTSNRASDNSSQNIVQIFDHTESIYTIHH